MTAIVVRAAYLGEPQLVRDEATSWYLASQSPADLLRLASHETFPPLYVLLLRGWMTALGDSEAALRSLSVLAGIGTVLVTWRWARDVLGNGGALLAGFLAALSPALVLNSRDARMYSLETFLATTAWWLLWLLLSDPFDRFARRQVALATGLALAVAGEVWTMSLGIPTAGLQLALALIGLAWLRNRVAVVATGCVVLGTASLAPWLPNLLAVAVNGQAFWTPRPDLGSIAATLSGWLPGDLGALSPIVIVLAGACALVGLTAAFLGRSTNEPAGFEGRQLTNWGFRRDRLLALAIALAFSLVPVVWVYSQLRSIYDPRYFGAAFPPVAIALASAAVMAARDLKPHLRVVGRLPAEALPILLAFPILAATAFGTAREVDASRRDAAVEPGRQTAQELAALVHSGDAVITLNAQTFFPLRYYLYDTGVAQRLGITLYDWHRPTAAFFTGWEDIDDASIVDAARVAGLGWHGAVPLAPGGRLWLVTLVDPGYEYPLFSPLQTGELVVLQTIVVHGGGVTAEIREAVPSGP